MTQTMPNHTLPQAQKMTNGIPCESSQWIEAIFFQATQGPSGFHLLPRNVDRHQILFCCWTLETTRLLISAEYKDVQDSALKVWRVRIQGFFWWRGDQPQLILSIWNYHQFSTSRIISTVRLYAALYKPIQEIILNQLLRVPLYPQTISVSFQGTTNLCHWSVHTPCLHGQGRVGRRLPLAPKLHQGRLVTA